MLPSPVFESISAIGPAVLRCEGLRQLDIEP